MSVSRISEDTKRGFRLKPAELDSLIFGTASEYVPRIAGAKSGMTHTLLEATEHEEKLEDKQLEEMCKIKNLCLDDAESISELDDAKSNSERKYKPIVQYNELPFNKSNGKQCVIFTVTKDSRDPRKEEYLAHIGDVIEKYLKKNMRKDTDENRVLLLPMRQCRGYFKIPMFICNFFKCFNINLQREHIVLVAVDLKNKTVVTHDSQSKFRRNMYPDRVKSIAKAMGRTIAKIRKLSEEDVEKAEGFTYEYQAHGTQHDNNLCGYYVHKYATDYMISAGKNCAEKLSIDYKDVGDKKRYMQNQHAIKLPVLTEDDKRKLRSQVVEGDLVLVSDESEGNELEENNQGPGLRL